MQQTTTDITIVDARPEHAPFIAWVMLTAARSHVEKGMWDFVAGPDEARTLRFLEALASTDEAHWAHYSLFLVAEVGGRPASALCGYFDEEHGTATLASVMPLALQATGVTPQESAAGWQAGGSIALVAPEHVAGAWIVEHVATLPEFRRQGLVDRLLEAVLEKRPRARRHGRRYRCADRQRPRTACVREGRLPRHRREARRRSSRPPTAAPASGRSAARCSCNGPG